MIKIFPEPQEIVFFNNSYESAFYNSVNLGNFDSLVIKEELTKINPKISYVKDAKIIYLKKDLDKEEYKIKVDKDLITIEASTSAGAYYATLTLKELLKDKIINSLELHDYPNLKIRGVMIDISRNKVPSLDTLKRMVYDFSTMRINHLELYVEGFSFEFKDIEEIHRDNNYITIEEIKELEKYCNDYFIDLVPNANGFGHMTEFLQLDKYKHLGECEEDIYLWGSYRKPATLDFRNKESLELVKLLYKDMIPHFKSAYFNMNCDEPMELGWGKNKTYVEEHGVANCYLEYVTKLKEEVLKYHKIPMIWGDVLVKHPEVFDKIPKDMIFIDWGYGHDYDFDTHCKNLKENNITFMTAPGTNTWATIFGKDVDMKGSIDHAVDACIKYQGLGILNTDWGDFGHLQYLPSSYPGFIYASYKAWSKLDYEELEIPLAKYFDPKIGKLLIELSGYSSIDTYRSYGNTLFTPITTCNFFSSYSDEISYFLEKMKANLISDEVYKKYLIFFMEILEKLSNLNESTEQRELINNTKLLLTLSKLNHELNKYFKGEAFDFTIIIKELDNYSVEHQRLWNIRNKPNGYYLSIANIKSLIKVLLKLNGKDEK